MTDKYAVIGNPINHSKSPQIHAQFAKQAKQILTYSKVLGELGNFSQAIHRFRVKNGKGLNVTVPFKQDAWTLVDQRNTHAEKAGAVNTIIMNDDGTLTGDNTDGIGLVADLIKNLKCELTQKRILILGAGGAVRGVLGPILAESPEQVVIANRTKSKADELAELFSDEGNIDSVAFDDIQDRQFDLIINGTAASLSGEVPPIPPSTVKGAACYDMMYGAEDTVFMAWAREQGASHVWDGLGMLVEQAAESFYLWRHVRPDTKPVIASIRASMLTPG